MMKMKNITIQMGHLVMLIGYGEPQKGDAFNLFLNSHGMMLARSGFGFVSYDELE